MSSYRIVETGRGFKIQSLKTTSFLGFFKKITWSDLGINYMGRYFQPTYYKMEYQAKAKIDSWEFKDKVVSEYHYD